MSIFPWTKYIDQHTEDPEDEEENLEDIEDLDLEDLDDLTIIEDPDNEDPDTFDQFAKKEEPKQLTKKQLTELRSLHKDLIGAEKELEKYVKKPPPGRSDLEKEILYIRDAIADLIQDTGTRRVEIDKYVYVLRKVATYFKVTSESKAISTLKKRKLSRFIKLIESISMSDLRKYLIEKNVVIPGLKKVDKDVSVYIYERHGEDTKLVRILHPEGVTRNLVKEFAETVEDLTEDFADKTMAVVGSREVSLAMREAAQFQTKKALEAGWNIVTGGARGADIAAVEEVLRQRAAQKLIIYLPQSIEHQPVGVRELLRKARAQGAKVYEHAGARVIKSLPQTYTPSGKLDAKLIAELEKVPYGRAAGARDSLVVKDADAVVAVQRGRSRGTQITIDKALKKGLDIKHIDEKLDAKLLRKVLGKVVSKSMGNLAKALKTLKILPGLAPILEAVEYGKLWKDLDNLEKDIKAGTANETQKKIWEWLEQQKKASEDWDTEFEESEFEVDELEVDEFESELQNELQSEYNETFAEPVLEAIIGTLEPTSKMSQAAKQMTGKALNAGRGVATSGGEGIAASVILRGLDALESPAFKVDLEWPEIIEHIEKKNTVYAQRPYDKPTMKVTIKDVGPGSEIRLGEATDDLLKKHLNQSGFDSVEAWKKAHKVSDPGKKMYLYKFEKLPVKSSKLVIYLKGTLEDQPLGVKDRIYRAKTNGARIIENARAGQVIDAAESVTVIQKTGKVSDAVNHALKTGKPVKIVDQNLKIFPFSKSGSKIFVKSLGSLVGKVLKGVGRVTSRAFLFVDAIELGILWKDIDTLADALEKGTLNENQKKIYEALQRKREAGEDLEWLEGESGDQFAELKKMAIIGQTSVTPGMLKAARFQAYQAAGAGWGISVYGTTGMHAGIIEETLKRMATKGRSMQFAVPQVKEYLDTQGVVYTQRSYDLPNEKVIVDGVGPGKRTKIGEVTDDLLKKHVSKSGFKSLKEWEAAKLKFGPAKKFWLYKVEQLPKSDKLTIYLSGKVASQTGAARSLINKAKTYGAKIIENAPEGKIISDSNAVVVIKSGHSVPKAAEFAAKAGKPVRMINESLKKFSVVKSGSKFLVKEVGSLVGKFLKGIGRITPAISILVDAIELGILWKDIDTLPEALEKNELNENQQKIYEALQRKREASEDFIVNPVLTAIGQSYSQSSEEIDFETEEAIDFEAEKDEGLEWHLIPEDQRLGDIRETIDDLEPRKSDPFPKPVVEFIKEKNEQGMSIEEIDRALVEMIEKGNLPTWIMHISDSERYIFTENSYSGLYLTSPHSELIHTGAKTAIVKSKKFTEHINEPLYLISDDKCYGVIKLSEPEEIDKEEFDERYEEHLVENFERKEWWNDNFPLFIYEVEVVKKFEPVRGVEIPRGIQVFLRPESVKFK